MTLGRRQYWGALAVTILLPGSRCKHNQTSFLSILNYLTTVVLENRLTDLSMLPKRQAMISLNFDFTDCQATADILLPCKILEFLINF